MSMMRSDGTKIVLSAAGPEIFWKRLEEAFQTHNPRTWRDLAMLALRVNAGWPVERIGRAFGHRKGHVSRRLERIQDEIRLRFDLEDLWPDPIERTPPPNEP
jgi:hypothetical protein